MGDVSALICGILVRGKIRAEIFAPICKRLQTILRDWCTATANSYVKSLAVVKHLILAS